MITEQGYSKDPTIMPEGIIVTFGKDMINEQGGLKRFLKYFNEVMGDSEEGCYWMHKCKNNPVHDIIHVYVIIHNRLYCRCYFGGYRKNVIEVGGTANGEEKVIDWPHIILSGPIERPHFKRTVKGFQGFRYCTNLF